MIKISKVDVPAVEFTFWILTPFVLPVAAIATFPTDIPDGDFWTSTLKTEDPGVSFGAVKVAVNKLSSNGTPVSVSTTISVGGVM